MTPDFPRSSLNDRELEEKPQVVKRAGGWFATGLEWSGPWVTREAAEFALEGSYAQAAFADRAALRLAQGGAA